MKKPVALFCIFVVIFSLIAGVKQSEKPLKLKYVEWDVYMLGIDTPEKLKTIRAGVKRTPVIAVVSLSGVNTRVLKGDIKYVFGPHRCRGMHDTYQISEVLQIGGRLGMPLKIKVYFATGLSQIAEAFRRAGKEADIVITYSSFWRNTQAMLDAVAANPDTLYISPYVEVGNNRTNKAFQGGARHPDGSGLKNFITSLPLCRHRPSGELFIPKCRDKNDIETVNFIAPSSYASSRGETCPSAGVTAVTAAYIIASSTKKLTAEQVIQIMLSNTSFPEKRMLKLSDYNAQSVQALRKSLQKLTSPDAIGIRRLESDAVLDLWEISQYMRDTGE